MSKARTLLGSVGTAAAATALMVGLAPQAWAADYAMNTDDDNPGGRLEFTVRGDKVKVCDLDSDGWGVAIRVQGAYTYTHTAGAGWDKCETLSPKANSKYDLGKGTYLFKVCLVKGGRYEHCDEAYWNNSDG